MSQRGNAGRFQSRSAVRTVVDEQIQSTVTELADGSKEITAGPQFEDQPDGSVLITAPVDASVREDKPLDEPVIFTNPIVPNMSLAGSLYKVGPGQWKKYPIRDGQHLRFINGHLAARTEIEVEKVLKHFKPDKHGKRTIYREPAPLLSAEKARERGIEPPLLHKNGSGKVLFWTYHREALEQFTQTFNSHQGI